METNTTDAIDRDVMVTTALLIERATRHLDDVVMLAPVIDGDDMVVTFRRREGGPQKNPPQDHT